MVITLAALLLLQAGSPAINNDFVQVSKNSAPCAAAGPSCGERVVVALGQIELGGKKMTRGEIRVFKAGERYAPPTGGDYFEVAWKPNRPKAARPPVVIAAEKNDLLYDGERFFVFEEKLAIGDTRARHSHSQRVVVRLNSSRLQQWVDGQPEFFQDQVPNNVGFSEPVVHTVKSVGKEPLRNIVLELKP